MSTAINTAIIEAQKIACAVGRDSVDKFGGYNYASAEDVIIESRKALAHAGLALFPVSYRSTETMLFAKYRLAHTSGDAIDIESDTPIVIGKGRPPDKAVATAKTYDLSYTLRGVLLLPRVEQGMEPDGRDDREYQPPPKQDDTKDNQRKKLVWDELKKAMARMTPDEFADAVGINPEIAMDWRPTSLDEALKALDKLTNKIGRKIQ